jgi:hypothetical protein
MTAHTISELISISCCTPLFGFIISAIGTASTADNEKKSNRYFAFCKICAAISIIALAICGTFFQEYLR